MFKMGIISKIDYKKAIVKVAFREERGRDDGEKFETGWLPVLQLRTSKDKYYTMPDKGEQVVCMMDEDCENGVCLGAVYSEVNKPTGKMKQDTSVIEFDDGTSIVYDRAASKLTIDAVGNLAITIGGNANVDITGVATIKAGTGTINLLDSFTGSTRHLFI